MGRWRLSRTGLILVLLISCSPPKSSTSGGMSENMSGRVDAPKASLYELGDPIFVRIFKIESLLEVWFEHEGTFKLLKTYPICYFSGKLGPKLKEGDRQAPEGFYYVNQARMNPNSRLHKSFNLGYPNAYDRAHGRTGSYLMVHGNCVSIGCYAMTDPVIDEIYTMAQAALDAGQPYFRVHSFPFRLTPEALAVHGEHSWYDFWVNLKEGYDWFETARRPPDVDVVAKRYVFEAS